MKLPQALIDVDWDWWELQVVRGDSQTVLLCHSAESVMLALMPPKDLPVGEQFNIYLKWETRK